MTIPAVVFKISVGALVAAGAVLSDVAEGVVDSLVGGGAYMHATADFVCIILCVGLSIS